MTGEQAPPPFLRPTMTPEERALVVDVVGEADEPLLRALRDARGKAFERLEFLGDSVLDVVMAAHAVVAPNCEKCPSGGHHQQQSTQRFVTDERLAHSAATAGLGAWLEWDASPARRADLVEACVAVAWLAGGWARAVSVVDRVVHPVGVSTQSALERGHPAATTPVGAQVRTRRRLGAALLELAAAQVVFTTDAAADEGVLSARRAALHRAAVIARHAREQHLVDGSGPDPVVSDRVEEVLAAQLIDGGADLALATARTVLVAPRRRT